MTGTNQMCKREVRKGENAEREMKWRPKRSRQDVRESLHYRAEKEDA